MKMYPQNGMKYLNVSYHLHYQLFDMAIDSYSTNTRTLILLISSLALYPLTLNWLGKRIGGLTVVCRCNTFSVLTFHTK